MVAPSIVGLSSSLSSSVTSTASKVASPFANALGQAVAQSAAAATASATSGLQQQANSALQSFQKQFQALLAANHVDTSQPIQLVSDGQGGFDVSPDNPNSAQIESLLHDNPQLVAQLGAIAQSFTALRAADTTQPPPDSLSPPKFGVTFSGGTATVAFS